MQTWSQKLQKKISRFSQFGGITKAYFGGGGSSSPEQITKYTPDQMELLKTLTGQLAPQIGQGVTPYGGQRVAGISPLQEQAFGMAPGYIPGIEAGFRGAGQFDPAQAGNILDIGQGALSSALAPYDPAATQQYWETAFKAPALETWRQDIMPSIMEKGVRTAGTSDSGPMQRELARSGMDLSTNLNAQLAGLLYSGEQAQLNRQVQGAGVAGGLAQVPGQLAGQGQQLAALGLGQMAGMGGEQRGISQQFLGAEQQKFMEAQPYQNPWLQYVPTALGASAFDTVIGQEGPSMASEMAPYAMAAALYFSDVRVKENVKPITGALEKIEKLAGYSYNYKFNSPDNRNGGVMAQALEEVLPDAVSEIGGVKYVRYDAVVALLVNAVNELRQEIRSN